VTAWRGKVLTDYSGDVPYALVSSKDRIYYLSLHSALLKGFKIKITELNASTGTRIGQPIPLSSDSEVTSEDLILHVGANSGVPILIWTDKAFKTLKINPIGTKQVTSVNVPSGNGDSVMKIIVHAPRSSTAQPHFLVHYQAAEAHWAEVYHTDPASGVTKKAFDFPLLGGRGAFSANSQGSDVYFTRHTEFEDILFSSADAAPLSQWNKHPKNYVGMVNPQDITHAASEVIPRAGSTYAVRSALASSSGHWGLIRNGEPFWVRHEYLSGTIAAAFLEIAKGEDLAGELAAESQGGPLGAYVHRIKRHVRDLQYLPAWAEALPKRFLGSFIGDNAASQDQSLRRDSFGFHKIVLVATEYGRLAALDAGNQGKVIWSIQAVTLKAGQKWELLSIEAEENTALVRAKAGEFLRMDSNTGKILQYQPGAMISSLKTSLKTSISIVDASGKMVLIPIKDDGSLGDLLKVDFGKGTIIVTEGDDGVVRGWSLSTGTKPSLAWQFLPAPGEKVHSVNARPSHDPVASIGKALGDRNVLYKYLNPNILLVTAVGIEASTTTFYIIDSTSGAVIYSTTQTGVDASQPIVVAFAENWFAYSLFTESIAATQGTTQVDRQKLKGYQLVITELYESPYPNDRGSLGSSSNFSNIYPTAADEDETLIIPHGITQTHLLPGPISSMSISSTLQGITTRSILCALPDLNSIISISRAFIDPRRPVSRDPTTAEMEEGLFRHSPALDFEPKWIISHKRDLLSVSDVITSPSLLESTSLVFAFGEIDLFGTRVANIGAFDILGKGFSKLQLVLTVVALAVGTTIVAPFVSPPINAEDPLLVKISTNRFAGKKEADRWNVEGMRPSTSSCTIPIGFIANSSGNISRFCSVTT